jgi:hypothetical protein
MILTRSNTIISTTQQLLVVSLLFTIIKIYNVHDDGVVVVLGYQPRFNSILLNKISRRQHQHNHKTPLSLSLPFFNDKENNDNDIGDERSVMTEPANGSSSSSSSSSSNFGDDSINNNEVETETDLQPGTAGDGPSGSSNYYWSYSTTGFELTQAGAVGATTGLLVAVFKLVSK